MIGRMPVSPSSTPSATAAEAWRTELCWRMRHLFALKFVGVSVFTWLFFLGYFHTLRFPVHEMTVMPLTLIDRLVPFQPEWLVAYFSLWVYVGVAPGLERSFRELVVYGVWVAAMCLAGLGFFYLWPTQIPASMAVESSFPGFALMRGVDAAGNACPSMHVAVAMFTAIRIGAVLRRIGAPAWARLINLLWLAAISYSTLAVKQHVALDMAAGALLGLAFALPSLYWRPRPSQSGGWRAGAADIIPHR